MNNFQYKAYAFYPASQQLKNEDGSPGLWTVLASIIRWRDSEMLALPVSWYPPAFESKAAAEAYASEAVKEMIDSGRCTI